MAQFCGVLFARSPQRFRSSDLDSMLSGFLPHGEHRTYRFIDPTAGFGLAAIDQHGVDPSWLTDDHDVVAFSGAVSAGPYCAADSGQAAAGRLAQAVRSDRSLEALAGDFALAHWSRERRTLTLANDPFGLWPIFTFEDPLTGALLFATEPKALLGHPLVRRGVDPTGLGLYLYTRHIEAPFAAFRGMRRLHYGERLTASVETLRPFREMYWRYPDVSSEEVPLEEWGNAVGRRLRHSLAAAVEGHERIGLLLGAGIDSSLLYGMLKTLHPEVTVIPITAFYPPSPGRKRANLDLPFARRLAAHWGDRLVEVELSHRAIGHLIEPVLRQHDQPFFNLANTIATLAMAQAAMDAGASVLLTGQGAEENFGMSTWSRLAAEQAQGRCQTLEEKVEFFEAPEHFSTSRQDALLRQPAADLTEAVRQGYQPLLDRLPSRDVFDMALYGIRVPIRREHLSLTTAALSAMTPIRMHHIFCDWHTVQFGAQIPAVMKGSMDLALHRRILLELDGKLIPDFVYERTKRGLPGYVLADGGFPSLERRLLSAEVVKAHGIFNPAYFQKVLSKKHLKKSLLMAQLWLDIHVFRTEEAFGLIVQDLRDAKAADS